MKKPLLIFPLVFLLFIAFSCQKAEEVVAEPVVDVEADVKAIRKWVNLNYAATDSGDLEGYLSIWAEDVIWMPPNALTIQGKSAVMEYVQPSFGQFTHQRDFSIEEIKVAGDFAFARVDSKVKYKPITGEGKFIESNNKGLFLFQHKPEGTWLCTHGIWNSNDPLPTLEENQ